MTVTAGSSSAVRAATQLPDGDEYQLVSLRLDGVRDTGTYVINAPYSAPREIDTLAPPDYGAQYVRNRSGGWKVAF